MDTDLEDLLYQMFALNRTFSEQMPSFAALDPNASKTRDCLARILDSDSEECAAALRVSVEVLDLERRELVEDESAKMVLHTSLVVLSTMFFFSALVASLASCPCTRGRAVRGWARVLFCRAAASPQDSSAGRPGSGERVRKRRRRDRARLAGKDGRGGSPAAPSPRVLKVAMACCFAASSALSVVMWGLIFGLN